jgi:hypothetical protein
MPDTHTHEKWTSATFTLSLCGGALERHHRRTVGDIARQMPWETLAPERLTPQEREAAARRWTGLAFNEYRSAILMAQLLQVLGEAQVPLDLQSFAGHFPIQELAHAELCGRLAARFEGTQPVDTASLATRLGLSSGLSPRQRCNELVVRLCCVSETYARAWLACWRDRVGHPLLRAVFARLLRDEALHSRFGWLYLEWAVADGELGSAEGARLVRVAEDALRGLAPHPDRGAAGPVEPDWLVSLPPAEQQSIHGSVEREVRSRLSTLGLGRQPRARARGSR